VKATGISQAQFKHRSTRQYPAEINSDPADPDDAPDDEARDGTLPPLPETPARYTPDNKQSETRQAGRATQMALVQVKATTLLIRKERLDTKSLAVLVPVKSHCIGNESELAAGSSAVVPPAIRIETFFSDQKSRGFHCTRAICVALPLVSSLIACCLAYIWLVFLERR